MKLPKIKKPTLCQVLQIAYHLMFLSGSSVMINGYLDEIARLRQEIHSQSAKAEKVATDLRKTGEGLRSSLEDVKKACSKIRF